MKKLKNWLKDQGFSFGRSPFQNNMNECKWQAYRISELTARRCESNSEKEGMQIIITPYEFSMNSYHSQSVEVELYGEANGIWWKLLAYSIKPEELESRLPEIESSLIAAWNALKPSDEEYDGTL